jgi:hypothetical protein
METRHEGTLRSLTLHGFPLGSLTGIPGCSGPFKDLISLVVWNCTETDGFLEDITTLTRPYDLNLEHLAVTIDDHSENGIDDALDSLLGSCKHLQSLCSQ